MAGRNVEDSPTRLTEFAPLSSDARPSGGFFSRFFKRKENSQGEGNESRDNSRESSVEPSRDRSRESTPTHSYSSLPTGSEVGAEWEREAVVVESDDLPSDSDSNTSFSGGQPRTLSSVLRRLSNILDRRSQTPQAYKDSDFKQYWMPDSDCKECYECSDKFNTFRRRHHCRICGQIFCSRCCNQEVPGKIMGYTGYLRVCTYCCKVVLSYAQNQEASGDLRALSEDLKHLSAVDDYQGGYQELGGGWNASLKRKTAKSARVTSIFNDDKQRSSSSPELHSPTSTLNPFDVTPLSEYSRVGNFQQERKILTQDSVQLRELWLLIQHPVDGIEMQSHRHRLRTYPSCVVGSELVDWLIIRDKAADRVQAVAIGQALVDAKWLECVTSGDQIFRDEYSLYRPGEATTRDYTRTEIPTVTDTLHLTDDEDNAPSWFREIRRTDEDSDSLSEFNKIPSTVSGVDTADGGAGRSVFYVDGDSSQEKERLHWPLINTAHLEKGVYLGPVVTFSQLVESCSKWEQDKDPHTPPPPPPSQGLPGVASAPPALQHQDSVAGAITEELFKGAFAVNTDNVFDEHVWQNKEHLREENGERLAYERLSKAYGENLRSLTNQLLTREGLSLRWSESLISITRKIAQVVRPDVKNEEDDMDIRQYVQIKKIPGGSKSKTGVICGVVCTKNVTHKKMRKHITNPKILLLRAPIEYQRIENKFSSLEPQILQEDKYLKNCVSRIAALEPDILLVEKSASRVAQDFLLHSGITLVLNVKASVMERVARFTQADIVSSIDGLVSKTSLGFCHTFRLQSFSLPNGSTKTLMFFDGCASHLGCTVTLRGGSLAELKRVKKIMFFLTYASYHAKLETAFLMDEFAMPPPGPDENEFAITSPGSSPTNTKTQGKEAGQRGSVEVAQEALPGAVTSTGVMLKLEGKDAQHQQNKGDKPDINRGTAKSSDNSESTISPKDTSVHSTKDSNDKDPKPTETTKVKKAETTTDTNSPSRHTPKRLSREVSAPSEVVQDFSDPLQNYQKSQDESIFQSDVTLTEVVRGNKHQFRKALDDVILSVSPYLKYDVPYLKTDAGDSCVLRKHFPKDIYWSRALETGELGEMPKQRFQAEAAGEEERSGGKERWREAVFDQPHPFVTAKLTAPLGDPETQRMLVDFRARGGRIQPSAFSDERASRSDVEEKGLPLQTYWDRRTDCLDPHQHQRIAVLFSSFSYISNNAPNPCVNPWIVSMDFYGRNDITLGGFLERYCFREDYMCPSESCDTPMVDHIRRFVHDAGCIQIVLKKLDVPIHGYQNAILTWSWCRKCKQVTPVSPLSMDTWHVSFAKYLDLRFHGNMYRRRSGTEVCAHPLHHDHYQYFGCQQIVASFKYVSIVLKEIVLPPMIITMEDSATPLSSLVEEAKTLSFKGAGVYSTVLEHLHRLKRDAQTDAQVALLTEYINQLQIRKELYREYVDEIQTKIGAAVPRSDQLDSSTLNMDKITVLAPVAHDITDSIVEVKRQIVEDVTNWNARIQDFEQQQRKLEKTRGAGSSSGAKGSRDALETVGTLSQNVPPPEGTSAARWHQKEAGVDMETEPTFFISRDATDHPETSDTTSQATTLSHSPACTSTDDVTQDESRASPGDMTSSNDPTLSGQDIGGSETSLSAMERSCEDQTDASNRDIGVKGHYRSKSLGDSRRTSKQLSLPHDSSANELDRLERSSKAVKQLFTSLLSSSESAAVIMPFSADEHHLLPACDSVPIVVYDQEPSSIIAYTLSSAEYERELRDFRYERDQSCSPNVRRMKRESAASGGEASEPEPTDDFTVYGASSDSDKTKGSKSASPNVHIELQFADSTAKFYCRVYYADQFRQLRKIIFPAGEQRYIRSLSRCFTWLARGGKSGSTFCKTQDDRFILKQMSRLEVQSFVDFAPHYFQYITQAQTEDKPTVLAKILGVYRIGYRNTQTNTALKQDLLVMENLFYNRRITQIFDLKGSMRNRLVNTSGKRVEDLVLLDENLLKLCTDSPLYIRPHSKTVLTLAITNDTSFLSSHLVMDYSLLVGIDELTQELVVGIIDYIRTFTWDKKLEMVAKSTFSQLGGQGRMPTVVSPELYRSRFLEAMDRYFLLVPDRWSGLGRNVDC